MNTHFAVENAYAGIVTRRARADIRRDLQSNTVHIADVLRDRPVCLAHLTVAEVLLMSRGIGRTRLSDLNRLAIRDAVNLMVTVDRVSDRTVDWLEDRIAGWCGVNGSRRIVA